ncbi:MAG: TadE/TadG family type IV pilus assembly protein [Caulobacterales bacterium]|uniref:TadE/TadG family type IV pilus assembly protein n=1 Tax=Glycocaulis sp. TaxID=1969725 RepID=UPI003FA176B8
MKRLARFFRDRSGNVAVIFALSLVPVMGLAGVAVDTAQLINVRTSLQAEADATALNAAVGGPTTDFSSQINAMNTRVMAAFGGSGLTGLSVNGNWDGLDFTVDASARVPTILMHSLPGVSDNVRVAVRATARLHQALEQYEPPEVSWLDPEAGDYNRVYVYCFDPDPDSGKTMEQRRTQRTPVQDNNGVNFLTRWPNQYQWPRCEEGEAISFELYNLRFSRNNSERIDQNPNNDRNWCQHTATADFPNPCRHRYFSDTSRVNGEERHAGLQYDILETILCDSLEDCRPASEGGILPSGTGRTPQQATQGCSPGRYMYFGWEDRPPGLPGGTANWTQMGWTDRDYDDIRIIMECPALDVSSERYVRLIE